ncbi:MAG TPA: alkaline phosphatase family protein [Myxococcales bacterium]|nr:alkaline phosphatase family protein [Myxococcales bacterium]
MRRRRAQSLYRRLGLPPSSAEPGRKGLLLLQIDSLSYFALQASLNRRFLPFLSRLVRRGGYRLQPYQTGLFYGVSDHVAGFRWMDKRTGRVMNVKRPEDAAEAEAEAARQGKGLLEGGSAHCSIVSGGSDRATLVLSRVGTSDPPLVRRSLGEMLALFFVDLWMVIRLVFAGLFEVLAELVEGMKAEYEGRMVRGEWPFLLVRVLSNVIFRELTARNVIVDVARGVPVIYANFAGYDELAHHRGPMALSSRLALRGTDARVREIFRAVRKFGGRDYDVFVFSDHGSVPTVPFERLTGHTLQDTLAAKLMSARDLPSGVTDAEVGRLRTLVSLQRELAQIVPRKLASLPRRLADYIEKELPPDPELRSYRDYSEIALLPTSDVCHVYLTSHPDPLSLGRVRYLQPALWRVLVGHPAIWAVVGRGWVEEGRPIAEIATRDGWAFIDPSGEYRTIGEDPFQQANFPEGIQRALHRFAWSANAGDAILIGAKSHNRAVNFQEELGGHGGPYPEEQTAFMISPPHVAFDFSKVAHHTELYDFFYRTYRAAESGAAAPVQKTA